MGIESTGESTDRPRISQEIAEITDRPSPIDEAHLETLIAAKNG